MRGTGTVKAHLVAAGKYHDIDFARLELLKLLAEHPEIRTSVSSDYADTARIEAADLLVTYTCDLVPTPDQTATIRAFLERGGRWPRSEERSVGKECVSAGRSRGTTNIKKKNK